MSKNRVVALVLALVAGSALAGNEGWPRSNAEPNKRAAACNRTGGREGLVPCCNDVPSTYTGECGVERPPAPTVPKVPVERCGDTAGLQRL